MRCNAAALNGPFESLVWRLRYCHIVAGGIENDAHPVAHAQPVHRLQAVPPVARLVAAARQDPCRRFMRDFGSHCPGHGSAYCASTGRVECRCTEFRCGRQRCSHGSFSMMGLAKSRSTCTHVSNSVHAPQCYTRHARLTALAIWTGQPVHYPTVHPAQSPTQCSPRPAASPA